MYLKLFANPNSNPCITVTFLYHRFLTLMECEAKNSKRVKINDWYISIYEVKISIRKNGDNTVYLLIIQCLILGHKPKNKVLNLNKVLKLSKTHSTKKEVKLLNSYKTSIQVKSFMSVKSVTNMYNVIYILIKG